MRSEIEKVIAELRGTAADQQLGQLAQWFDGYADDLQAILDANPVKCSTCDGTGWVPSAFFPGGRGCGKCGGAGTMEADDE